jgi:hypothetical protein
MAAQAIGVAFGGRRRGWGGGRARRTGPALGARFRFGHRHLTDSDRKKTQ